MKIQISGGTEFSFGFSFAGKIDFRVRLNFVGVQSQSDKATNHPPFTTPTKSAGRPHRTTDHEDRQLHVRVDVERLTLLVTIHDPNPFLLPSTRRTEFHRAYLPHVTLDATRPFRRVTAKRAHISSLSPTSAKPIQSLYWHLSAIGYNGPFKFCLLKCLQCFISCTAFFSLERRRPNRSHALLPLEG